MTQKNGGVARRRGEASGSVPQRGTRWGRGRRRPHVGPEPPPSWEGAGTRTASRTGGVAPSLSARSGRVSRCLRVRRRTRDLHPWGGRRRAAGDLHPWGGRLSQVGGGQRPTTFGARAASIYGEAGGGRRVTSIYGEAAFRRWVVVRDRQEFHVAWIVRDRSLRWFISLSRLSPASWLANAVMRCPRR